MSNDSEVRPLARDLYTAWPGGPSMSLSGSRWSFVATLLLLTACASPEVARLEQPALVSRSLGNRWTIGDDGLYHIPFYVNPAGNFRLAARGARCAPGNGDCDHGV